MLLHTLESPGHRHQPHACVPSCEPVTCCRFKSRPAGASSVGGVVVVVLLLIVVVVVVVVAAADGGARVFACYCESR